MHWEYDYEMPPIIEGWVNSNVTPPRGKKRVRAARKEPLGFYQRKRAIQQPNPGEKPRTADDYTCSPKIEL